MSPRRRRRRRRAHAPAIHAAGNVAHGKRDMLFSISMNACSSVPIVVAIRLAALRTAGPSIQVGSRI